MECVLFLIGIKDIQENKKRIITSSKALYFTC